MSIIIVSVLLLVIGGIIVFAIMLQLKEQARLEKIRKVAALNNQLRQIRRYLDDMPAQYQPKDMRLWLYSRLIKLYDGLLAIQPDPTVVRRRKMMASEATEFQTSKQKRRVKPINDELMILELSRLFDSFLVFIKQAEKDKTLTPEVANRYLGLVQLYKYKVHADYHAYLGRQAFLSGSYENALEHYKSAIAQLSPIRSKTEAKGVIAKFNESIAEIEKVALTKQVEQEEVSSETAPAEPAQGELNNEWEKFIDDSAFKKKKHF